MKLINVKLTGKVMVKVTGPLTVKIKLKVTFKITLNATVRVIRYIICNDDSNAYKNTVTITATRHQKFSRPCNALALSLRY